MNPNPIPIALDLSCVAEYPVTGIGYAALYQVQALAARHPEYGYRVFATGDRRGREILTRELPGLGPPQFVPYARLAKYSLWTRLSWPPIEWFTGPVRIAHNFCHQTPATRGAVRLVTVHDLSFFRLPETHTERTVEVQSRLLRQCAREADGIVAVSESCRDELVDVLEVAANRIHVVPNGVRTEEFDGPVDESRVKAIAQRIGVTREYFIHLGTIEPRKNLVRLIEAYSALHAKRNDCPQLLLVGKAGWKSEPIFEAMRASAAAGDIAHAGYLAREDAIALLRGARACVYPSLYEGFGLPILEAMAARTPVVTSASTSLPEVGGDACLYVDPLSVESIMDGLGRVLDDEGAAKERVEIGRTRALALSWDSSADALAAVYRDYL